MSASLVHSVMPVAAGPGRWRAVCECGWQTRPRKWENAIGVAVCPEEMRAFASALADACEIDMSDVAGEERSAL